MSVLFSRSCEYGLRAVIFLAQQPAGQHTRIKEISEKLSIPMQFLAKIMQILSRSGLLHSYKGPNGGFELARPADQITPLQIVEAIDGLGFMQDCLIGLPECIEPNGCPVHEEWGIIRDQIVQVLASKSIADLARRNNKKPDKLQTGQ